jgi:hypothetical protein
MSEFLEILKVRHAECQKRFQMKQAQLNAVNAEFQAVAQEFNSIQTLMNLEIQKANLEAARVASPAPSASAKTVSGQISAGATLIAAQSPDTGSNGVNKTEIVRGLLRQHASGMTPSELWREPQIKAHFDHRAYLYSILKRLKDRGDITEKRGKYCFKFSPKEEEIKDSEH